MRGSRSSRRGVSTVPKTPPAWVLDQSVSETEHPATNTQVQEALDALQIKGISPGRLGIGEGTILVALVKHLMRSQGFYATTGSSLDGPPGRTAAARRPTKQNPMDWDRR